MPPSVLTRIVELQQRAWSVAPRAAYAQHVGRCQLVFVDADHFEPGVTTDSRTALALVDRQDRIVLRHDALRVDVQSALPRLARSEGLPISPHRRHQPGGLVLLGGRAVEPVEWKRERES